MRSSWSSPTASLPEQPRPPAAGRVLLKSATVSHDRIHMIELNPIRQRIASLIGRLDALRGFL